MAGLITIFRSSASSVTGTATAAFAVTVPAAVGTETFTGSAAAAFSVTRPNATGTETFTGTAAAAFAVTLPAASGTERFTGAASATFGVTRPDALGVTVEIVGAGSATFAVTVPDAIGDVGEPPPPPARTDGALQPTFVVTSRPRYRHGVAACVFGVTEARARGTVGGRAGGLGHFDAAEDEDFMLGITSDELVEV